MPVDISVASDPASAWLMRFAGLIKPEGRVLEIACGNGRNTRFLKLCGFHVTAVDVNVPAAHFPAGVDFRQLDLEQEDWPLTGLAFDAVVGINYLWRVHWASLWNNLSEGGLFIYETFTGHQFRRVGKPRSAEHLLGPNELLNLCRTRGEVVAYEEGFTDAAMSLARIVVRKGRGEMPESRLYCPR